MSANMSNSPLTSIGPLSRKLPLGFSVGSAHDSIISMMLYPLGKAAHRLNLNPNSWPGRPPFIFAGVRHSLDHLGGYSHL